MTGEKPRMVILGEAHPLYVRTFLHIIPRKELYTLISSANEELREEIKILKDLRVRCLFIEEPDDAEMAGIFKDLSAVLSSDEPAKAKRKKINELIRRYLRRNFEMARSSYDSYRPMAEQLLGPLAANVELPSPPVPPFPLEIPGQDMYRRRWFNMAYLAKVRSVVPIDEPDARTRLEAIGCIRDRIPDPRGVRRSDAAVVGAAKREADRMYKETDTIREAHMAEAISAAVEKDRSESYAVIVGDAHSKRLKSRLERLDIFSEVERRQVGKELWHAYRKAARSGRPCD